MRNTKELKIKKAVASVLIVLAMSMSLSSSISLAQQFDETKSAVAYCSQPLKVEIGPVYDYRYFVYASKVGSADLNIKFDKGYAIILENLYPGSKAQLDGQITIKDSTSFILHNLEGGELKLSGDAQFAPSEKCDELVAAMTAISGYSKQKLVEDEDLVSAQMELVKAMTVAAGVIVVKDVYGYRPEPKLPSVEAEKDAVTILKYLDEKGYRGQKVLDKYNEFISKKESQYPFLKEASEVNKDRITSVDYSSGWLDEIRGQITENQRILLKKLSESEIDTSQKLSPPEMKQALEIMIKEKIYKHPSQPSKWLSLIEYLNEQDKGYDIEYKIIEREPSSQHINMVKSLVNEINSELRTGSNLFDIYAPQEKTMHLEIWKRGTKQLLYEVPIFPDIENPNSAGFVKTVEIGNTKYRIMGIGLDKSGGLLQKTASTIVHEITHATASATGAEEFLLVGDTSKGYPLQFADEGSAVYAQDSFARNQGSEGFEFTRIRNSMNKLKMKDYMSRSSYGESPQIFRYIFDKYGQQMIDKIMTGKAKIDEIVDFKGLHSNLKVDFLLPQVDEINTKADKLLKIADKEKEIKNTILKSNMKNPDISKINGYIDELNMLSEEIKNNPSLTGKKSFIDYIKGLQNGLEAFRDAPEELREEKFYKEFIGKGRESRAFLANKISENAAENVKDFGGIYKNEVPDAQFNAVEDAANKLLEKTRKIKNLGNNILTEKSLQSLNTAENSILKFKVPEELTKTAEVAKKSSGGQAAIGAGTAMVFALGPKFVEYGEENNNPYLVVTGETIEYSGIGLLVASAGATVATWMKIALPQVLKGLVLTSEGFLSGTVIGLLVVALVEMVWCVINPFGPLCFTYIQPTLTLSKTKAFTGEKISYEISGFDVKNGIGNQEGKKYILTYQGSFGLQLGTGCTVSSDKCKGEFTVPVMKSDTIKIFAQDLDNTYKSTSVTFEKLKSQLTIGATVATDKSYLCMFNKEWKGETELEMACAKI